MPRPLGQHFLYRAEILERIAEAACPAHEELVLEIGAGDGALTAHLLPRARRVIAVELDARLARALRARFPGDPRLEILQANILDVDLRQWGPLVVAGNLPYYISTPILQRVSELGPLLKRAALLVQREVAERVSAAPGSRQYGFLSVCVQLSASPEILFRVSRRAFSPPPKVESALLRLTPRAAPLVDFAEQAAFLEFAGRCFRYKRKTLRNNLAAFYDPVELEALPESALRAEQLSLQQLVALYRRLARRH